MQPMTVRKICRTMSVHVQKERFAMATADERIEFRVKSEDKALLARAAVLEHIKLSQFVLWPALKRAREVVAEADRIATTEKGYRDVLDALANPPEPSKALIDAMREYNSVGIQWR